MPGHLQMQEPEVRGHHASYHASSESEEDCPLVNWRQEFSPRTRRSLCNPVTQPEEENPPWGGGVRGGGVVFEAQPSRSEGGSRERETARGRGVASDGGTPGLDRGPLAARPSLR